MIERRLFADCFVRQQTVRIRWNKPWKAFVITNEQAGEKRLLIHQTQLTAPKAVHMKLYNFRNR